MIGAAVFIGVVLLLAIVALPATVLPWLSPSFAVRYSLKDDGKSPMNWSSSAIRFWGDKTLDEYIEQSDGLNQLTGVAAYQIGRVVSSSAEVPMEFWEAARNSQSCFASAILLLNPTVAAPVGNGREQVCESEYDLYWYPSIVELRE